MLKADFHIHTSEDPEDLIRYSATELIDMAHEKGYRALSITNHNHCTWSKWLCDYARERDIVLIPGMEATIQRKHVLLFNFDFKNISVTRLADLYNLKDKNNMIIAPHPCFPSTVALQGLFFRHIDLFDAVELSHFWCPTIDFNKRALKAARKYNLPVVGTSDAHQRRQFAKTWSLVDAEPDPCAVIQAVKQGRIDVQTNPIPLDMLVRINARMFYRNHVIQRVQRTASWLRSFTGKEID